MAVVLYKNNQAQIFDEHSYLHMLEQGWSYSRKETVKPKEDKPEETEPEDAPIILVDEIPEGEVDPKPEPVKKAVYKRKNKKR